VDVARLAPFDWGIIHDQLHHDIGRAFREDLLSGLPATGSFAELADTIQDWFHGLGGLLQEVLDPAVMAAAPWPALCPAFTGPDGWSAREVRDPLQFVRAARDCDRVAEVWLADMLCGAHLFEVMDPAGARASLLVLRVGVWDEAAFQHSVRVTTHLAARGEGDAPAAAHALADALVAGLNRHPDLLLDVEMARHTRLPEIETLADLQACIGFVHDDRARRDAAYAGIRRLLPGPSAETLDDFFRRSRTGRLLAPWGRRAQAWIEGRLGTREAWARKGLFDQSWEDEVVRRGFLERTDPEARAAIERLL
jgi:hypothetical protein